MLKDIWPGAGYSDPMGDLVKVGSNYLFRATDPSAGAELWRTNGTKSGTVRVKDIFAGSAGSDPAYMSRVGKLALFEAEDAAHGFQLWRSDGTRNGTQLIQVFDPGGHFGLNGDLVAANRWWVVANDGTHGVELWVTNGFKSGSHLVADVNPSGGFEPRLGVLPAGPPVVHRRRRQPRPRALGDRTLAGTRPEERPASR